MTKSSNFMILVVYLYSSGLLYSSVKTNSETINLLCITNFNLIHHRIVEILVNLCFDCLGSGDVIAFN